MTPFLLALLIGFVLGVLSAVVVPFLLRELSARRALARRTAEWREYEARRWARVVGSAVSTPVPFKRIEGRRVA